jgi:hypothetical protein
LIGKTLEKADLDPKLPIAVITRATISGIGPILEVCTHFRGRLRWK